MNEFSPKLIPLAALESRKVASELPIIDPLPVVDNFPIIDSDSLTGVSRRRFLEAAGFSMSLAFAGCHRAPAENALPFVIQSEGVVPGRSQIYASTCGGCSAGCGLLVSVRDGRPLKMEGMPEHPLSRGGLCAIGQALPLGLYDIQRLVIPLVDGKKAEWKDVDKAIVPRLEKANEGGTIALVTPTITSPTMQASIDKFAAAFGNTRHFIFDAVSSSAILDAHPTSKRTVAEFCHTFISIGRPSQDRPSMGIGHRPQSMHGLLGLLDRVSI